MSERKMIPLFCGSCGAPMRKSKNICEYCETEHEPVERYNGPEFPEFPELKVADMSYGTLCGSTAMMFGSYDTYSESGTLGGAW